MSKERILIFVDWFLPGYKGGGPIQSIAGLIENIDKNFDIDIITRNTDHTESIPYSNIAFDEWMIYNENVRICYLSRKNIFSFVNIILRLRKINFYKAIYTNSFFSFRYSIIPCILFRVKALKSAKLIVAPRGEMFKINDFKPYKKKPFIFIVKLFKIYSNVIWHATSQYEVDAIEKIFRNKINYSIITNLSPVSKMKSSSLACEKKVNLLKIVFISRIVSYKNLDYVLDVLGAIYLKSTEYIIFDIYGTIEDEKYWKVCQDKISDIETENLNIQYKGKLNNSEVVSTFEKYELFFLPTHAENYGHIIAEALIANVPLLISDTTPWKNFQQYGCGWVLPLSEFDLFKEKILIMLKMNSAEFLNMKSRLKEYAAQNLNRSETVEKYISLFS